MVMKFSLTGPIDQS